jgi:hypothetical protein
MIKYYLLPKVINSEGMTIPAYLENFPSDQKVKIAALPQQGDYFLIKVNTENQAVFDYFEAFPDVINRDAPQSARLSAAGINLPVNPSQSQIDEALVFRAIGENKTLEEAFGRNGE